MKKRGPNGYDPPDQQRRELVKGGLLAAAAALGFLPACGEAESAGGPQAPPRSGAGTGGAGDGAMPARGVAGPGAGGRASGMAGSQAAPGGPPRTADGMVDVTGSGSGAMGSSDPSDPSPSPAAPGSQADGAQPPGSDGMGAADPQPMPGGIPRAMLGMTGVSIPILGLGTSRLGQRGSYPTGADWDSMLEIFAAAIDKGIEYVDTGAVYGRAEEALGEVLQGRRNKVFLVTKLHTDSYSSAARDFERSLERMGTDHVDLLHLHNTGSRNLDVALSDTGSWPFILEQKAKGLTRFVGITGHNNPPNLMRMLDTGEVDVMMAVMNFVDHTTYGFSDTVRAAAVDRGVGVMAMKVFGGTESGPGPMGGLANSYAAEPHPSNMELAFDENALPDCMRFVKALPGVNGMVVGVNHLWELERNIQWAIETQPFSDEELQAVIKLGETVAPTWAGRYG